MGRMIVINEINESKQVNDFKGVIHVGDKLPRSGRKVLSIVAYDNGKCDIETVDGFMPAETIYNYEFYPNKIDEGKAEKASEKEVCRQWIELVNEGDLAGVKQAIKKGFGSYINCQDKNGNSPLMIATYHKNIKIMQEIIDNTPVDVNHQNKFGETALHFAVLRNNHEGASLLMKQMGIKSTLKDKDGKTPLMLANEDGDNGMAHILQS